jgi:hypothetical protein
MESSPPLSACPCLQPLPSWLTRRAGDVARATIDGAVRLLRTAQPPFLGQPFSVCMRTLTDITMESEAAWTYAARAGVYEGVVRVAEAYPDDAELQYVVCGGLSMLGSQRSGERWLGHSAAGARAGAVRVVAAAVRKHGARSMRLLSSASPALTALLESDGADWEAARSGHAGMALAAGLAVALRDTTGVAERFQCAPFTVTALAVLGRDVACAQDAACGGALLSLTDFLRTCGADVSPSGVLLVLQAYVAIQYIASHAPAAVRARTADAAVAAVRFALSAHHDSMILQFKGWYAVVSLLLDDAGAQSRAVGAGMMADIVRTLEHSVSGNAADDPTQGAMAAEAACRLLDMLTGQLDALHAGHREVAGAAGAVAAVLAVLRAHGAHNEPAAGACYALTAVVHSNWQNTTAARCAGAFADLAAVMRTHGDDAETTLSAVCALEVMHSIEQVKKPANAAGDAAAAPFAFAKEMANAGVLEVTADALLKHTAPECMKLGYKCFNLLVSICIGELPMQGGRETLLPCLAARAKRAGVEAALSAMLARTQPPKPFNRAAAERVLAALAKVPAPRACDGCGTADAAKLMRCSRCMAARFCGQACMRASWPAHKLVCTPVAAASEDA